MGRLSLKRLCSSLVGLGVVAAMLAFPATAAAPVPAAPDQTFVVAGDVWSVARAGDTLYLGGYFNDIGPRTGPWVGIDRTSAKVSAGMPEVYGGYGVVYTAAPDGGGGWYIGGSFTHVGSTPRLNLARVRSNGTVDPAFDPRPNATVVSLAVSGSTVYAAGEFTSIGGKARKFLAALDQAGNATTWDPNPGDTVNTVAVSGSRLFVGGNFTSIAGEFSPGIAGFNVSDGSLLWTGTGSGRVGTIAPSGSTVYVGGTFSQIGGQARANIAALDAATGTATSWNPGATAVCCDTIPAVFALAVSGTTVYAGGQFSTIGGQPRGDIAAIDSSGSATSWNPNAGTGVVRSLAVSGTTVYAGGEFAHIGGQDRPYLAALDATGAATAWNPRPNSSPRTLSISGSSVFAGGYFSSVGTVARHGIAALNVATGQVTPWNPGVDNAPFAFAVEGSTLYVGGAFSKIAGQPRTRAAAFDTATGNLTAWSPKPDSTVWALAAAPGVVYMGGDFSAVSSQPRHFIAAVAAATGSPTSWNPNANQPLHALALSGSLVYAGGAFTSIGGKPRNGIAALNATDGLATSWNPNAPASDIHAVLPVGPIVYAGGYITSIGGQPRSDIAGLSATTGAATSWNPGADETVYALAQSGGAVYAGGQFTTIGGQKRSGLAELDAATGKATSWAPNPDSAILAVVNSSDGSIYAGGSFNTTEVGAQSGVLSFSLPPQNTAPPAISPRLRVGRPSTCSAGSWAGGTPQQYAFAWSRDGTVLAGETTSTLTPRKSDAGHRFTCSVTATNRRGTASAMSAELRVPPRPRAVTRRATRVKRARAVLRGIVTPNGETTKYYFQYGRTRHYAHRTRLRKAGAGLRGKRVAALVKRLRPGKIYHFRVVAISASGKTFGVDRKFRTRRVRKR